MQNDSLWHGKMLHKGHLFGHDERGAFISNGGIRNNEPGCYISRCDEVGANSYHWIDSYETDTDTALAIWYYKKVFPSESEKALKCKDKTGVIWKYAEGETFQLTPLKYDKYWKKKNISVLNPIKMAFSLFVKYGKHTGVVYPDIPIEDEVKACYNPPLTSKLGERQIHGRAFAYDAATSVVALNRNNSNYVVYKHDVNR
ncbi:MAG: hypothetical protein RR370_01705 [Synergistaceae bacterium]